MTETNKFALEDSPEFEGQDAGWRWNGFACPSFTREQANVLAEWWHAQPGCTAEWDEEAGGFAFDCQEWDGPECFLPDNDGTFPIGAGSWCWNRADDF